MGQNAVVQNARPETDGCVSLDISGGDLLKLRKEGEVEVFCASEKISLISTGIYFWLPESGIARITDYKEAPGGFLITYEMVFN